MPPRIPDVNHRRAVNALKKAGFHIVRESKHIIMSKGNRSVSIPRGDPIKAGTMGAIAAKAGLSVAEFKKLL